MKNVLLYIFFLTSVCLSAQDYISEGQKRLNFAQTYMEAGGNIFPKFLQHPSVFQSSLTIGGIHFWGHADFYVTFPLANTPLSTSSKRDFQLFESAVTGARFMPFAFRKGRFTPYLGTSWSVFHFKQGLSETLNTPRFSKNALRFDAGFIVGIPSMMLRGGINYLPFNNLDYPLSKIQFSKISLPTFYPSIGVAYIWETTYSKSMEEINKRLNDYPSWSTPKSETRQADGFFVGIGMSSSFRLEKSSHNEANHPYLDKKPISVMPDIAIGYHFGKQGLYSALSYRNMNFNLKGYGTEQQTKRQSFTLETVAYLFDYHGFTPYIGTNVGFDKLTFNEKTADKAIYIAQKKIEPGFTFGWDILPGKTQQKWVLRTNLRWYPWQSIAVNGKKHNLSQLEYNFIQLVWYPARSNHFK